MKEAFSRWTRRIRGLDKIYVIEASSGTGRRHFIENAGMPKSTDIMTPHGNLYIEIVVKLPSSLGLSPDQAEKLISIIHAPNNRISFDIEKNPGMKKSSKRKKIILPQHMIFPAPGQEF
jgi:DnaJ-class molecular chaperone